MRKTIFVAFIAIVSLTLSFSPVLAQDAEIIEGANVIDEIVLDTDTDNVELTEELIDPEEVSAEELEISEPGRFSWFRNAIRTVQIAMTRDPIKKSELELKKAGEQLLRIRKTVQEKLNDPRLQERLEEMDGKYETLIGKINTRIENYQTENPEEPKLKDFLDKYTSQQLKHQEILKKVEEKAPENVMEKIRANREIHLEKFGEVMNKLQTKEELKERLQSAIDPSTGSASSPQASSGPLLRSENLIERRANRAGILEELEEKVPAIREQIEEIKRDGVQLFQELKVKQEEIQQNQQELKERIREKEQNMTQENQEIKQETREQIQENNPGVGERIMNVFRNKEETNTTPKGGQTKQSPTNAGTDTNR